jgi:hypothetical protein
MTYRADTQFINDTIYSLKREYGFPLTIFKQISSSVNVETGIVTPTISFKYIHRAIFLPRIFIRMMAIAEYDANSRLILIDFNDLGNFTPNKDDYVIFQNKKYIVNKIITHDYDAAVVLNVQESIGSIVSENFESESTLELISVAVGVKV